MGRGGGGGGGGRSGGGGGSGGGRGFSGGSGGGRGFTGGGLGGGRGFGGGSSGGSRGGGFSGGGHNHGGGFGHGGGHGYGGGHHHGHHHHHHGHGHYGWGWGRRRRYGPGPGCGCSSILAEVIGLVVLLVIVVVVLGASELFQATAGITKSTVKREPLPRGSVVETDYYTDELGWIGNRTELLRGMRNFYDRTGVQPHLYITDNINGSKTPTPEETERFAIELYDRLFEDPAHLLLIFAEFYTSDYITWYQPGYQARSVIDQEAGDILLDYADRYYYQDDLTDEQYFSKVFDAAGIRIMEVTTSPWVYVWIVVGVLAIILVLFLWRRAARKGKQAENEQLEQVLNTPLETFGDDEASKRAKDYE